MKLLHKGPSMSLNWGKYLIQMYLCRRIGDLCHFHFKRPSINKRTDTGFWWWPPATKPQAHIYALSYRPLNLSATHQGLMKALRDLSSIQRGAPLASLPLNTRLWVEGDLPRRDQFSVQFSCMWGRRKTKCNQKKIKFWRLTIYNILSTQSWGNGNWKSVLILFYDPR